MVKMPHWPVPLWFNPINLGLERMRTLLEALGSPHKALPPVVHIAGTNGKGSTLAFLRSILEASGYVVHCYTSPHLVRFNERIHVSGHEISDEYLYELLEECRIETEKLGLPITFFEGTTAAAFLAFARNPADIVLLETGLGGRLDATNLVDHPMLTILTSISFDHMQYLGDSIAKIAYEKAGIMKAGTVCVSSMQMEEAEHVFEQQAELLGVNLIQYGYDWGVKKTATGMTFLAHDTELALPAPALIGDHQYMNAGTAIAAAKALQGFVISEKAIAKGLQNAHWPARLQQLKEGTLPALLPEGWELWLDGAHNEAGGHVLSLWAEEKQDRPLFLISGMTKGRDSAKFFESLQPFSQFVCGLLVEAEPSSHPADYITEAAKTVGIEAISCDSVEDAIRFLIEYSTVPARILICGSLYLAGSVLEVNAGAPL